MTTSEPQPPPVMAGLDPAVHEDSELCSQANDNIS